MTERRLAGVWFQRIIVSLGVIFLLLVLVVCLMASSLFQALLTPALKKRGAVVDLDSVSMSWSGVEVSVLSYEEPELSVKAATFTFDWSELLELPDRFSGKAEVDSIVIQLPADDSGVGEGLRDIPAKIELVAKQLHSLPINQMEVKVGQLSLRSGARTVEVSLAANLLTGFEGERHVSVELQGALMACEMKLKLSESGSRLGVDFIGSGSEWERFSESYLPEATSSKIDVYIEPVAEGAGFIEFSGYLRWDQQAPEQCGLTVLADIGALEVYTPTGEAYFGKTTLGLAMDGTERIRSFGKGAVESVRLGSWSEAYGQWEFKINNANLAAEIRLSDSLELSFSHDNWRQLSSGVSEGRFLIDTKEFGFGLLHELDIPNLPQDLESTFDATIEGEYRLNAAKLDAAKVDIDLNIKEGSLPTIGVTLENANSQANVEWVDGNLLIESCALAIGALDVHGIALSELALKAAGQVGSKLNLEAFSARLLGGELRVGALQFDPLGEVALPVRIELDSIDMQRLSDSVPQFKGEVEGRLSGHLLCQWHKGSFRLKDGLLQIDEDVEARLRYNVDELLTRGMDVESAAYEQYRLAEVAFQNMLLKRFRVDVFSEGEFTRPLRIQLYGESKQEGVTIPVDYTLNLNADDAEGLMHLLRMIQRGELELN